METGLGRFECPEWSIRSIQRDNGNVESETTSRAEYFQKDFHVNDLAFFEARDFEDIGGCGTI